jgi:hypothetical protein
MAEYLDSDYRYRGLIHHDDRSYLFDRQHTPGYRFGRTHGKRVRFPARRAISRLTGHLKLMIEAIADAKLRRMERELELRGIRVDRPGDARSTRNRS